MAKYKRRADGRYETKISTGMYNERGKLISKTIYGRTIKELDEKIASMRYELSRGTFSLDKEARFDVYSAKWLEIKKASRGIRTKSMYNNILQNHTGLLDKKRLCDITASDIQLQINQCIDHPRTAQQVLLTIRQVFKSALIDGIIFKDPSVDIELPRLVKKERRALTSAEKKAIKTADFDSKEKAFILTLYCTGMRPAEAYALTWNDINFRKKEITINKSITFDDSGNPSTVFPKTNSGIRVIESHEMAINALKAFKVTNNHFNVFCDEDGEIMRKFRYDSLWCRCKRKIEASLGHKTDITPYYFRHNFCTELYYSDISLKEAQRLMGHSDVSMIMKVYSHLDAERENTKNKIQAINF